MRTHETMLLQEPVAPQAPWYVADERITSRAAAREAEQIARRVRTRYGRSDEPDEQALFTAFHTCAFQTGRHIEQATGQADVWLQRWHAIREYLVERNLGLVHVCMRRFRFQSVDEDDVLSEAMCALGRAIDRFNPWRGFRFSTYACNVIVRALMRRGKTESRRRQVFPVQHDESYEKAAELPDADKELRLDRLRVALDQNLGRLTDLEVTVLSHRFCEDRNSELTFQEIGQMVGLSKERVRQIQNTALGKLRAALEEDPVLR